MNMENRKNNLQEDIQNHRDNYIGSGRNFLELIKHNDRIAMIVTWEHEKRDKAIIYLYDNGSKIDETQSTVKAHKWVMKIGKYRESK